LIFSTPLPCISLLCSRLLRLIRLNDLERCQRANHVICQGKIIILGCGCSKSATCADKKLSPTFG